MKVNIETIAPTLLAAIIGSFVIILFSPLQLKFGDIPFTLQTFGVGLVVTLFKWKVSVAAVCLYLFFGLIGFPIFAGGAHGWSAFIGPTGGYLLGFLGYAIIMGGTNNRHSSPIRIWLTNAIGVAITFLIGNIIYSSYAGVAYTDAFSTALYPFLIFEVVKVSLLTYLVSKLYAFIADAKAEQEEEAFDDEEEYFEDEDYYDDDTQEEDWVEEDGDLERTSYSKARSILFPETNDEDVVEEDDYEESDDDYIDEDILNDRFNLSEEDDLTSASSTSSYFRRR